MPLPDLVGRPVTGYSRSSGLSSAQPASLSSRSMMWTRVSASL